MLWEAPFTCFLNDNYRIQIKFPCKEETNIKVFMWWCRQICFNKDELPEDGLRQKIFVSKIKATMVGP